MDITVEIFQGILIILYGLILSTRRKFMIHRVYDSIFNFVIISMYPTILYLETGRGLPILFFIIMMLIIIIMICKGKYTMTNTNAKMVSFTLTNILEEKGIRFEEKEKSIILIDYDNKCISYQQSFNTVVINLNDIKNLTFYEEIKNKLKIKIKEIDEVLFPTQGAIMLGLGILFIAMIIYL